MSNRLSADEIVRRKRELHIRIGRTRRRIDRRLRGAGDDARRLANWRTYATRYPGWSLAAALGAGLAASAALRPMAITRWMARAMLMKSFGGIARGLTAELTRIWTQSNPHE